MQVCALRNPFIGGLRKHAVVISNSYGVNCSGGDVIIVGIVVVICDNSWSNGALINDLQF